MADRLRQLDSLRPGLSSADAGDILSVLAGHDAYWRLTVSRGWSDQRYCSWLHEAASDQLLV